MKTAHNKKRCQEPENYLELVAQGVICPEKDSDHYSTLLAKGIIRPDSDSDNEDSNYDSKPKAKATKQTVRRMSDSANDDDQPKPKRTRTNKKPPQRSEKSFY